ncbi:MAG TPA: HlyD family efflux transporter periplasmic adaptor subunit [Caldimonas sp.]|nr:HlyD family efflux transporter periplasmic adaptor subunit [Caldimonas sp.]
MKGRSMFDGLAAWLGALPIAGLSLAVLAAGCARPVTDTFQGYVEGEFVYMASSQAGQLVDLAVQRGQTVPASALLFTLESSNEADAVKQAQHQLQAAESQRADLLTGKRPVEVAVNEAQLQQARSDAQRTATQLQRDEEQFRIGGIAKSQLDDSRAAAVNAQAHVRELEAQVQVARLPGREQQIRAQEAQVEAARAALAQAQWKLDQKQVHAAQAGLVFDTMYRAGEWVPAGSPVVRILPPQNVKVRFFVPQAVAGGLAPGRAVAIRCDGCGAEVPATVRFVSDQAEYTPPTIYSNDTRSKFVFMVEAWPQPADAVRLHPGQPVEVALR